MNAPIKPHSGYVLRHRAPSPDLAAALRAYDTAKTGRERSRALARIADLRAAYRQDALATEAKNVIDGLAAKWTAWRKTSP
jgi:hypothetical protein